MRKACRPPKCATSPRCSPTSRRRRSARCRSCTIATAGDYRAVGPPVRFDLEPFPYAAPAPALGEHTFDVLAELGYDRDDVDALVAEGVALAS